MELGTRKTEDDAPIFGLRYLEEEDAEINDIAGCLIIPPDDPGEDNPTQYVTNCDYVDYD